MSERTGASPRLTTAQQVTLRFEFFQTRFRCKQFAAARHDVFEKQDVLAGFVRALDVLAGKRAVAFRLFANREQRHVAHLRHRRCDDHAAQFGAGNQIGIRFRDDRHEQTRDAPQDLRIGKQSELVDVIVAARAA